MINFKPGLIAQIVALVLSLIISPVSTSAITSSSNSFERALSVEDENRLREFKKAHSEVNTKTNEAIQMTDEVAALIEAIAEAPTSEERNALLNQATDMLSAADSRLNALDGKNSGLTIDHEDFIQTANLANDSQENLTETNSKFFTMGAKLEKLAAIDGLNISAQVANDINSLYEMKDMAADLLESKDFAHYGNKLTLSGAQQLSYQLQWEGQFIKTAQIIVKRLAGILSDANDRGTLKTTITASLKGFNFSQPGKRDNFLKAVKTLEKAHGTGLATQSPKTSGMIWNRKNRSN